MATKRKSSIHPKCATRYCGKYVRKGSRYCCACLSSKYREKDPVKYAYHTLRTNAKRRKKFFDLTLEQFRQFCIKTLYIQGKGRTKDSYSIDRIEEHLGYTITNIQVLPVGKNKKKHLEYDWMTRTAKVV